MTTSKIQHADALWWLTTIEPGSAAAVVFDPPYGAGSNPVRGADDGAAGSVAGPLSFLQRTMSLCARALRPGGIVIAFGDHHRQYDIAYAATTSGLREAAVVAWVHNQPATGKLFRSSWQPVPVFSKGMPAVVDSSATAAGCDVIEIPDVVRVKRVSAARRRSRYEMPAEVYEHILARVCLPGDLIVDAFAGSGTSRDAAEKLGLRWRGCDVDAQYAEDAVVAVTGYLDGPDDEPGPPWEAS